MIKLIYYRHRIIPLLFVVISSLVFVWLYYKGQYPFNSHYVITNPIASAVLVYNIIGTFVGMALVSIIYARTAVRLETKLASQNREIKEAQLMLVQSEKMAAIGKLTAGLTHEINNPIGAIPSNTQTRTKAVERIQKQSKEASGHSTDRTAGILTILGQSLESTSNAALRLKMLVGIIFDSNDTKLL